MAEARNELGKDSAMDSNLSFDSVDFERIISSLCSAHYRDHDLHVRNVSDHDWGERRILGG